jgi:hypothetical protein
MPRYRRASELGAFAYCRRAWWLQHGLGLPPGNAQARARGERAHAAFGGDLRRSTSLQRLALVLLIAAALVLVLGLLR